MVIDASMSYGELLRYFNDCRFRFSNNVSQAAKISISRLLFDRRDGVVGYTGFCDDLIDAIIEHSLEDDVTDEAEKVKQIMHRAMPSESSEWQLKTDVLDILCQRSKFHFNTNVSGVAACLVKYCGMDQEEVVARIRNLVETP